MRKFNFRVTTSGKKVKTGYYIGERVGLLLTLLEQQYGKIKSQTITEDDEYEDSMDYTDRIIADEQRLGATVRFRKEGVAVIYPAAVNEAKRPDQLQRKRGFQDAVPQGRRSVAGT